MAIHFEGWDGAPPVSKDGFSFFNGEFFTETSGKNRHRRANPDELKTHFTSGNEKDHPAHWFEAQLLHYGLPPSKTKSVARMRLFDHVNAGKISVPAHISSLERELKKEWTKNNKAVRSKATKDLKSTKFTTKTPGKRSAKQMDALDGTETAGEAPARPSQRAPKKAKTTATISTETTPVTKTTKKTPASSKAKPTKANATPAKTVARARRGGGTQGTSRSRQTTSASSAPRPKAFARRGNASMSSRQANPSSSMEAGLEYNVSWFDDDTYYKEEESSGAPSMSYASDGDDNTLVDGDYELDCPFVDSEWPIYGSNYCLTLSQERTGLWGTFDLGVIEGVMRFSTRAVPVKGDRLSFEWRGREAEGPIICGQNTGWVEFYGDGRVAGCFDWQDIGFQGERVSGSTSSSRIDELWGKYSEEEYERERVSRWY